MFKDSMIVYWSPATINSIHGADWSYMYPTPKSLFYDLKKYSSKENSSYFSCPAVSNKFKKTLVCYNPIDSKYSFDFRENKNDIKNISDTWIAFEQLRKSGLSIGPTILFAIKYAFFAEEPLDAHFTSPFFHEPKYTEDATIIPGEFDIGKWFRPFNAELQFWKDHGTLSFEKDEPLFYVNFKTDKKIILKRFEMTEKIFQYMESGINNISLFGKNNPLSERYNQFKKIGMREKVITEIKKNLIDEEPLILN